MQPSEEVDAKQLEMARAEGGAYQASLKYMANHVADSGATQDAGPCHVGYAQEKAEGTRHPRAVGQLEWVEPERENCHLKVSVADVADHRFIPYLTVHATLTESSGEKVGPFVWHPGLFNDGTYAPPVRIEPPRFTRHDEKNVNRYSSIVEATFKSVQIKTGQG